MTKRGKTYERPPSSYSALCHKALDSAAYRGLNPSAKVLFIEAVRQHNGSNNGRLQLSAGWLKARGWKSADTIARAKAELVNAGLLVKTRQGGLGMGPDWFAITYLPISNASGLDITIDVYQRHFFGQWAVIKAPARSSEGAGPSGGATRSDSRTGTNVSAPTVGSNGQTETPATAPIAGHNVIAITHAAPVGLVGKPAKYPQ